MSRLSESIPPSSAEEGTPLEAPSPAGGGASVRRIVIKNALFLGVAQVAGMPLSMVASAVSARYLGAAAMGLMYLATSMNSIGNLAVDWGQSSCLPRLVAQDRDRAGALLGSSLVWRTVASGVVLTLLVLVSRFLGYGSEFLPVLLLVGVGFFFSSISGACQQAIIGFERTDVSAYGKLLEQFSNVLIIVPILLLGGGINAMLAGSAVSVMIAAAYAWRSLRLVGIHRLTFDRGILRSLVIASTPFAFSSVVSVLQPYIDALFLSKLTSAEVVGWYATAAKLVGVLIFPASAVIGALYPTLSRLFATEPAEFLDTARGALRGTTVMAVPVALGCFLYPDIGISMFNRAEFGPAEDDLRVLSVFVFLAYFTMPLGVSILAAGRQRAWAMVQAICVVVSLIADPLLIPLFQREMGNGGVGVCVAGVLSEIFVLICAIWMVPKGTFDRRFGRTLLGSVLGGAAMMAVAFAARPLSSFLTAPFAVMAYVVVAWMTGGVDPDIVRDVKRSLGSRLARFRGSA
jgi:O-antigen/teichoic acid export membrane protein